MANKLIKPSQLVKQAFRGFSSIESNIGPHGFFKVNGTEHYPVMYREIQSFVGDYLQHRSRDDNKIFQMVDCTFGGGGHSVPLLKKNPNLRVLGVDLDSKVLDKCRGEYDNLISQRRLALEHTNYVNVPHVDTRSAFNKKIGITQKHDIALLDLGFSSYQLEDQERGFSYMGPDEQPLDMRYDSERDPSEQSSAVDIVNGATEMELSEIFKKFGEERFHQVLARKLIEARQKSQRGIIHTTGDFKQAIRDAFPNSAKDEKNQMIKRAFQAVRIATNYELLNLQKFLEVCPKDVLLESGSLLMVITFHSLEEKIVSQVFTKWKKAKRGEFGTKKPLEPSTEECEENSRSKSAKLYSFLFN